MTNDNDCVKAVKIILQYYGIDYVKDENFKETPQRVHKVFEEMFEGLIKKDEIKNVLNKTFPSTYDGIVAVKNIRTFSLCPHHLVPVIYKIDIGYIPNGRCVGLSKISRLAELISKQPILQEDLTDSIMEHMKEVLQPKGIIVYVKGDHLCMQMRGAKKLDATTITSSVDGVFLKERFLEEKFLMMK
jgi:GTP cyclohydrolase I